VPSIVFPVAADQYFWARRIADLGAGPRTVSRGRMTAQEMARLFVRTVRDGAMRDSVRRIGEMIRAENGVANAIEALLPLLGSSAPRLTRRRPSAPPP
jgi:sterol 3beta-glucosyltransferase